jgi:predicted AAA+ superfamily ATPase
MRPMSLYESNDSNGTVSLADLFNGAHDMEAISDLSIEQIAYLLCRGGFPETLGKTDNAALRMSRDYVESIINQDISRVDGVKKIRSKTAIRTSPKHQFVDPAIATAVMRLNPEAVLNDFEYFGFLFESLCTRDMRIYAQSNDGEVLHYRDKSGLEADMIIQLHDGRWGAVEVKLGSKQIDVAAENLLKLKNKINSDKMREPSFLMVLTGGQYAFKRKDGVLVVPVGCLKN